MSWTKTLMMAALSVVFMTSYNCDDDESSENTEACDMVAEIKAYEVSTEGDTCTAYNAALAGLATSGTCADGADADGDGICDDDEALLGTRTDIKDVFVEIDYMVNNSLQGMELTKEALDLVKDSMAGGCVKVHLDAGDLHSSVDEVDPENYNYCGGNEVTLRTTLAIDGVIDTACSGSCTTMAALRTTDFDSSRDKYFHYAVIGQESTEGDAVAGLGEYPGKNFYVTLGFADYNDVSQTFRDGNMAVTLMHELGHNLYLAHGGDQDNNAKPNYQSIMNYAYGLGGLSAKNSIVQWQEYITTQGYDSDCGVTQNDYPFDPLNETWVLDFSAGTNDDLNENSVKESDGFGKVSKADYNCDGDTSDNLGGYNLDDTDGLQTLTDHDDWDNLVYDFTNFTGKAGDDERRVFVDVRFDVYEATGEQPRMLKGPK